MNYKSYLIEQNLNIINENVILFYGENIGLKNEFRQKIKTNKSKSCAIINLNQDEILQNNNILFNEINNLSLFEEKKIILINLVNDKILDFIREVEQELADQKIYLFSGVLEKKSKLRVHFEKSKNCAAVACYNDNEITIKKIIQNRLKDFKGLTPNNLNIIVDNSNLDRVKLNNELDKIIAYFRNKSIETEALGLLLDAKINDDFNLLKDQALLGNKVQTNRLLSDTVMETEKNVFYLNLINYRLNRLLEANRSKNDKETAINNLKPPIFWKDKPNFINQANKWNKKKINVILEKTYNLEIDIKSHPFVNKNTLIKKLIIDICTLANA